MSRPFPPRHVVLDGRGWVIQWVPAWFDLSGLSWLEVCVPGCSLGAEMPEMDPLAMVLGVMPGEVVDLLGGERLPSGVWCRRSLRDVSSLQERLQITLLRGALEVWKERCRAVNRWWRSPEAELAVRVRSELLGEIMARGRSPDGRKPNSSYASRMKRKRLKRLRGLSVPEPAPRRSARLADIARHAVRRVGVAHGWAQGGRRLGLPWF